jgi:transposase/phosphoglycolate phosphatase-like HAD superfamily hydrolase
MTIGPELQARILRLYHIEKWRLNTIALQLRIHHSAVQRVVVGAGIPYASTALRSSGVDPYVPFIVQTLEQYPTLTAARLFFMVRERGYQGSPSQFRHRVALLRPRPAAEAYLRLRTLPGEVAQVDWAHFGHLQIGRARRPLMAFVMVLSFSRRLYLRFFLDARMASFLAGHSGAFAAFGGCTRVIQYDNLKSAVLERRGEAIRFNPTLLAFAAHHHFEPRPVAVARGNEKGRVERAIRHVRQAFFAARSFADLDDLNTQATAWCDGPALERPCPEDRRISVADAFRQEQPLLVPLPTNPFAGHERVTVRIGKTPYARFDLNDYSVPHTHVRRTLTVLADTERVRIVDGITVLAEHARSYDRDAQIEDPAHLQALVDHKRGARQHRTTDLLIHAVPPIQTLLARAAQRGYNLGSVTAALNRLRQRYTIGELHEAVLEALGRDVPHPNAVRLALERRRDERGLPATTVVTMPEHLQRRDVIVTPHHLDTYDGLTEPASDEDTATDA